ncbi:hypothetical protein Tco_1026539, partial [Tanacetum coccineum]
IPSPPLLLPSSPTHTSPTYDEAPLGKRAAIIQDDLPKADMPLQKRSRFTTPIGRFEIGMLMYYREAGPQDGPTDAGSSFADALAEHKANISRNGDDRHDSRTSVRRQVPVARECTYTDFLKCQTLNCKGTEGVVGLTQWGEIKKLEIELWNLKVKGTDVESYNQRFQEWALMCKRMFLEESDEVEKYVGGLPDMIQGSVMAS